MTNTDNLYKAYSDESIVTWKYFKGIISELKTKNRFSNEKLDVMVDRIVKEKSLNHILEQNTILYRARLFNKRYAEKKYTSPPLGDPFKGYNKEDSFINPENGQVEEGRCNPEYIAYLYASQSVDCCIHEVRPDIASFISVAQIHVNEDLKLIGLDREFPKADSVEPIVTGFSNSMLLRHLYMAFSRPYEEYGDYLLSQYVSEKVKNYGFDGISFHSAVYSVENKKTNYVIFNYEKCEPIGSKLYRVKKIDIQYE